jgi:NAD(P)-dependent dehydrogenase (short-subunit alcohol dehydrogenase family)
MTRVAGAVAVVTGAASGIGEGIAEALTRAGAAVVVADISLTQAEGTAARLGATAVRVDVADAASVQHLAGVTIDRFGRVDIVVNNAGVGPKAPIADMTLQDWRWLIDVNLFGVIHGLHSFLPLLRKNDGGGHIVNTSSMSAFAPMPSLGGYAVTKTGVAALTEVLSAELAAAGSPVRVSLLAPGAVATNIADSMRNRPPTADTALERFTPAVDPADVLTPLAVGEMVVAAVEHNDPYIITHPQFWPRVAAHTAQWARAFGRGS